MKLFRSVITTALALVAAGTGVECFWRLPCQGRSGIGRIDPLKNPGTAAEHVHVIHGGTSKLIIAAAFRQCPFHLLWC